METNDFFLGQFWKLWISFLLGMSRKPASLAIPCIVHAPFIPFSSDL